MAEDARKQRIFSSGDIFHNWIQDITKEAGLSIAQELELQDEDLMIRGHIDDLVLIEEPIEYARQEITLPSGKKDTVVASKIGTPENKKRLILYDYKTAHSKWFEYAKGRPMSHYNKMQLGTYMYMLRKSGGYVANLKTVTKLIDQDLPARLTEARILKISKDDLRLYEQQLLWTLELEQEVYSYWKALNAHWKMKRIPKCTCADYENGFMAKEKWNPYFYEGKPCSEAWLKKWRKENAKVPSA